MVIKKAFSYFFVFAIVLTLLFSFQNCGGRLTVSDQSIQTTDFLSTSNSEIDLSRFSADFSSLSGEETLIYLIAGQSNATGFGSVNSLPVDLKAVPSGVDYYFQDKKINYFSNLRDDNGDQSEDFGVEVGLATNLKKMFPNNKVVIIKVGVSGAPIKKWLSQYYENNQLLSGKSECYLGNSSLKCVDSLSNDIPPLKTVFNKIISNYKNPKLASFIWLQGESDALYWRETGNSYGKNLNLLFNQIKTEKNGMIAPPMPKVLEIRNPVNGELLKVQPLLDFLSGEIGNEPAKEVAKMVRHTAEKGSNEDVRDLLFRLAEVIEKMSK